MRIEELPGDPDGGGGGGREGGEDEPLPRREDGDSAEGESGVVTRVVVDAKRAAVGVGARMLFYPTLVYNVVRNRFEEHFHWWDQIDEHVLLGAVPFPSDVLRLKALGVCGVVTLNESYESLVPTSLYEELVGEELWREARKLEGDLDVKLSSYARWSTQLCPRRHR